MKNKEKLTIFVPAMLDETFELLRSAFASRKVRVVLLKNSRGVVNIGLKYVHNDLCYPIAIMTGQLVQAIHSGRYDVKNCAFLCAQAGDACRGSNYIPLLRKAMERADLDIPVLSFNFVGMEDKARFMITPAFLFKALAAVMYSDMLMLLKNQVRPYERRRGETMHVYRKWLNYLRKAIYHGKELSPQDMKRNFRKIAEDFAAIERSDIKRTRVAIVGELYMKYCAIGNRRLQEHFEKRGAEVTINGFSWYILYYIDTHLTNLSPVISTGYKFAAHFIEQVQRMMISEIRGHGFLCFDSFTDFKKNAESRIPCICDDGDGWLIGAEIVNHAMTGCSRVACVQPFGCMPNHVCGRGLYSSIQRRLEDLEVRLVSIDFDSSDCGVNIYNRAEMLLMPNF